MKIRIRLNLFLLLFTASVAGFFLACESPEKPVLSGMKSAVQPVSAFQSAEVFRFLFSGNPHYRCDGFQHAVGPPKGKGYYNAQGFFEWNILFRNNHLGEDWNGLGGGDTDKGDPVYSIANGCVKFAEEAGPGWGNVVRIIHQVSDTVEFVESLYGHLDEMLVKPGAWVKRGQQIGTIGDANGVYPAHLHLEVRSDITMDIGGGYDSVATGFLSPTEVIFNENPGK